MFAKKPFKIGRNEVCCKPGRRPCFTARIVVGVDESNRRALIKSTDIAIKQVKAELDRLQAFRTWIQGVGTPEVPLVGPIVPEFGGESESGQSTADFIEVGFLRAGNGASLTIPEILQWAEKAGWVTAAENPEQVIRTTVGRMMESQNPRIEGATADPSGTRRYRLAGRRQMSDR